MAAATVIGQLVKSCLKIFVNSALTLTQSATTSTYKVMFVFNQTDLTQSSCLAINAAHMLCYVYVLLKLKDKVF